MYIYKYVFGYNGHEYNIQKKRFEADETSKLYVIHGDIWRATIHKSDIGKALGYNKEVIYLLEDNIEIAKRKFIEIINKKINDINSEIQEMHFRISSLKREIKIIEDYKEDTANE